MISRVSFRENMAAIAFVTVSALASAPSTFSQDSGDRVVAVRMSPDAYAEVKDLEPVRTIDYGAFVWLELTAAGLRDLTDLGVEFERQPDPTLIILGDDVIDTQERTLSTTAATTMIGAGEQFLIIQLIGPTKDAWIQDLLNHGVEPLQYISPNAYLVRTSGEVVDGDFDFVRWVGAYHPEYRVASDVLDQAGTINFVEVTIYAGDGVDDTVAGIESLGGLLVERETSRGTDAFLTATFSLPREAVQDVCEMEDVAWMSHRPPIDPIEDEMSSQIIAGNFNPLNAGYQNWLNANGVNGAGVTIALIDSGYDTGVDATSHADLSGRLVPVGTPTDTNGHGTHVGGIMAGNASLGTVDASGFLLGLGVAPQATLVVRLNNGADNSRTQDSVTRGAVASNNSYALHGAGLGYLARDRTYDVLVRDADQATAAIEPLVIVFSAGNSGATGPTKEAKNIIAVANSRNQRTGTGTPGTGNINTLRGSSSRGPAQDGRTYPHLTAPGWNIVSSRSTQGGITNCTAIATGAGAPGANPTYSMCTGTSMAAPHVTGSVALITQWWQGFNAGANPSPAMAKALLVSGAVDMGTADIPNNNEGWGRINLSNVINTGIPTIYVDQTTIFANTGDTWTGEFLPDDTSLPVKVTVAWSDAPGPTTGGPALVNDIDLVVDESGTIYRGNVFANGFSTTGGVADTLENLENVFLQTPTGNAFTATLTGANIGGDGIPGNSDLTDQDFALVIQNAIEVATVNIIKEVDEEPDGAFDDDPSGWTFDVASAGRPTQTTDATGLLTFKVVPGTYDVLETNGPTGFWKVTASCVDDDSGAPVGTGVADTDFESSDSVGVNNLTLTARQNVTCTFRNKKDEAFINVVKNVDIEPDGNFDDDPAGWTFDVVDDGDPSQITDATGILQFIVRAGTYDVKETDAPAGDTGLWLVTASCEDDDSGTPEGTGVTSQLFGPSEPDVAVSGLSLLSGQSVTCTFDNQRMAGFVTGGGNIREGKGKRSSHISWGGNVAVALDGTLHGQWQANFHSVSNANVSKTHFHSESIVAAVFGTVTGEPPDPPFAVFNTVRFQATGRFNGQTCTVTVEGTDHGEPAKGKNAGADSDSIRVRLDCAGTAFDYDSAVDFPEEEPVGLHHLDGGNLQIHPPRE